MAAETELFLRRANELSKLVASIKSLDNSASSELQAIEEKLKELADSVGRDKCLNAGGKFEWVDSVLVKVINSRWNT